MECASRLEDLAFFHYGIEELYQRTKKVLFPGEHADWELLRKRGRQSEALYAIVARGQRGH